MTATNPSAPQASRRYCLITPCRNEAKHIRATLRTTTEQTLPPARWIIVDDGSTDETPRILEEWADRFDYIEVFHRIDRGARQVGVGVVDAFNDGLSRVDLDEFDYICKYDADLEMPSRYFERIVEHMEADPYLGNLSGKLFERHSDGSLVQERIGDENALGAVKFYRVAAFRDIGGLVRGPCWDGIDGHMCRMRGWIASSVDEPELRIVHLRPMGSSQKNIWVGRQRWGRGKYFMGSAWYYTAAVCLYRLLERPRILGGLGIGVGYLRAALKRSPRFADTAYRTFLREYEHMSLLHGKRKTLTRYNERIRARVRPETLPASGANSSA